MELQGRIAELRQKGLGLATISYDSPQVLSEFTKKHGITFPMLSDAGSATITRYGILNTVVEEALGPNGKDPAVLADLQRYATGGQASERLRGIPFPGTFMLDRQGRVTARFFEDYYWERNTVSNIMLRLDTGSSPVTATHVSTEQLELNAYPSDASVAPGTRFSLAVDIAPKRGIHIYAPGQHNYRVVSLNVTPIPNVRTTAVQYPKSETYYFAPLKERVPVYRKPFTLRVEAVPEATAEARKALAAMKELVINATLEYQACDDRLCFNPVSLPLSWKVELRPNVPQ